MRIERLDLFRYGSFTDRSLLFREGARLHLVYGPNEAGKSTALAAIADLLFGFPHAKEWDFLHEARALRLGATLVNRKGERISLRRRRGNKNTLLADDEGESPLRDDALLPFLGNLGRDVFLSSFGLNSERLQEGARALLAEDGDGRGALFAAASGRHAIASVRKALDEEAGQIFTDRRSKDRRFYQALTRYDDANRLMRERELRETAWKALNQDVERAQAALEEATAALREHRARERRLQRQVSLAPRLRELAEAERALGELDDLAEVTEGAGRDLEAAVRALADAEARERDAGAALAEAEGALAAIRVNEAVLERAREIADLVSETGAYRQRLAQIPRVQAEADAHDEEISALLRRLGVSGSSGTGAGLTGEEFDRVFPGDAVLARLEEEIAEGRKLTETLAVLSRREAEEQAALAAMDRGGTSDAISDPAPLANRFRALSPDLAGLDHADDLAARQKTLAREAEEAAARLDPPVDDIDRLASLPLPSAGEIDAHRLVLAEVREAIRRSEATRAERRALIERRAGVIAEAERGGDVPDAEAIRAARGARDAALFALPEIMARDRDGAGSALAEVARLTAVADGLADRALSEAERVSRLRAEREALAGERAELAENEKELERLRGREVEALGAWRKLFEPLEVTPTSPERMADWRRALEGLLAVRGEASEYADRLAAMHEKAEALRPELAGLAEELGLETPPLERVRALARRVEHALSERRDAWTAERVDAGRRADIEERLERLAAERDTCVRTQENWRAGFGSTLLRIGLAEDDTLGAAEAALAAWRDLPGAVSARDHEARRVAGMRRDNCTFEETAAGLVAALAPELSDLAPADAVNRLNVLRETALADRTRRESAIETHEKAVEREKASAAGVEQARMVLQETLARLPARLGGRAVAADPAPLLARLAERRERVASRDESLRRFVEVAEGLTREDAEHELEGFDRDAAQADLQLLRDGEEALTAAHGEATSAHEAALARRREAEMAEGAEKAAFDRGAAEEEMLETGREWSVLRIAGLMLDAALARHREAEGDPLLARAGEIFKNVTGGAYSGLSRALDEDDATALVVRRADGGEVLVRAREAAGNASGLSEGTLNQLYLALRLAFLSDYAERAEPAPFIGDDLFQTFDDARTANGLGALAELSGHLQPILFTHHRSVVDLAKRELGEGLDLIEL